VTKEKQRKRKMRNEGADNSRKQKTETEQNNIRKGGARHSQKEWLAKKGKRSNDFENMEEGEKVAETEKETNETGTE
jgi:hypothetical protein